MTATTITAAGASDSLAISSGNDGTLVIQSGPTGAKVNAVSIASDGTPTFLKVPVNTAVQSMVRVQVQNGYGSTNTAIRRFTTVVTNQGSDITYADSATLGASFTINTSGVYAITSVFSATGDSNQGISLNSTQLSTDISVITNADRLAISRIPAVNNCTAISWTGYLAAGSVVRAHGDGVAHGNGNLPSFTIVRVA